MARRAEWEVATSIPLCSNILMKVFPKLLKVSELQPSDVDTMYGIFAKYYNNHNKENFVKDLTEKNYVILLLDRNDKQLKGFSTLLKVEFEDHGRKSIGIYSGDTVLEKEYWGNAALGKMFLKFLWMEKVKNPFKPVYWFLISKGYKTYLLMANNFKTHFPRYEKSTPDKYQKVMDIFYSQRFQDRYDAQNGVINGCVTACCLKEKVAEITPVLFQNPRAMYFAERNPDWFRGTELACLAKMTLLMPLVYSIKKSMQRRRRHT